MEYEIKQIDNKWSVNGEFNHEMNFNEKKILDHFIKQHDIKNKEI